MAAAAASSGGGGGFFGLIGTLFNIVYFFVNLAFRLVVNFGVFVGLGVGVYRTGQFSKESVQSNKEVLDLIYWRDPKKSGIVFGVTLVVLWCLASLSVITVAAYGMLTLLAATVSLRTYKTVLQQMGKQELADKANPIQEMLDVGAYQLPADRVHKQVDVCINHINKILDTLRRLFLIEDVVETAKFAVLLWALTYVGAWFSGMGLIILAFIGAFTIPKFYEVYKEPIDQYWGMAHDQIKVVLDQVNEKLPFLKKKQN